MNHMTSEEPGPEWHRLGHRLVARRTELGFPKRKAFATAKGFKNDRVIAAIENAERTNYTRATLAAFEFAYEWSFGSIANVLAGGEPTPQAHTSEANEFIEPMEMDDFSGASWSDPNAGEWMSVTTGHDERGRVLMGTSVFTDEDDVVSRVEVKFWPGNEQAVSTSDFLGAVGEAHRVALGALIESESVERHLQAARPGQSSGRGLRRGQNEDATRPDDDPTGMEAL